MDISFLYAERANVPNYLLKYYDSICSVIIQDETQNSTLEYLSNHTYIISIFSIGKKVSAKAGFYNKKKALLIIYNLFFQRGVVDNGTIEYIKRLSYETVSCMSDFTESYFNSIVEAINFVVFVGSRYGCSKEDMTNILCAIILAWHGYSTEEMSELRKSDVLSSSISKTPSFYTRSCIPLVDTEMEILKRWRDIDYYGWFPTGKKRECVPSEWLMRSQKSEHMNSNNIFCMIRRFNQECVDYGKRISLSSLRKNGLFCFIRDNVSKDKPQAIIQAMLGCDRQTAFGYVHSYYSFIQGEN